MINMSRKNNTNLKALVAEAKKLGASKIDVYNGQKHMSVSIIMDNGYTHILPVPYGKKDPVKIANYTRQIIKNHTYRRV
jgi:hypothetical protein